jgi:hypothetical protein
VRVAKYAAFVVHGFFFFNCRGAWQLGRDVPKKVGFDDALAVGLPLLGRLAICGLGMKTFWSWGNDVCIVAEYLLAAKI